MTVEVDGAVIWMAGEDGAGRCCEADARHFAAACDGAVVDDIQLFGILYLFRSFLRQAILCGVYEYVSVCGVTDTDVGAVPDAARRRGSTARGNGGLERAEVRQGPQDGRGRGRHGGRGAPAGGRRAEPGDGRVRDDDEGGAAHVPGNGRHQPRVLHAVVLCKLFRVGVSRVHERRERDDPQLDEQRVDARLLRRDGGRRVHGAQADWRAGVADGHRADIDGGSVWVERREPRVVPAQDDGADCDRGPDGVCNEDRVNMPLFFGLVGLFNLVFLWPVFFILHFTGMEPFSFPPTAKIWAIVIGNSLSSFISDMSWAYAMLLTTPLVVTVGLSLTIPLSLIGEMIQYSQYSSWVYWVGAAVVLISFLFINNESHEDESSDKSPEAGSRGISQL
ncbi:hypothetical protein CSAL01_00130 [Colletotrichum salicis]|uniref:Vacuolar membrane protein n=1 Tax=Colletotrichum salicis TaxID=1209931 RepID=A0A135SQQ3_9PEZI|nr:hypothetical protein CSAL01_00130 [Colletotrichum salicis]